MKKRKHTLKSIVALGLTAVMLVNTIPLEAFAADPAGAGGDVSIEAEVAGAGGDVSIEAEASYPAFVQSETVDDVKITIGAEEGVFPEGAVLSAEKVTKTREEEALEAVEEERPVEQNVAASYTFDIKVLDRDGNEIQPADESRVKLSFKLEEVAESNLETNIYHVRETDPDGTASGEKAGGDRNYSEETTESNDTASSSEESDNKELIAEKLEVETEGDTATAETDGFSLYTVEFSYNDLQYVMPGDSEVALSEILNKVSLTGEVTNVEVSSPELFSAGKNDSGEWIVTAHRAFSSEEWMKVTINDLEYKITVTDDSDTMSFAELQAQIDSAANGDTVKLEKDVNWKNSIPGFEAGDSGPLVIPEGKTVTLDLNGHTINRGLKDSSSRIDGDVITVQGNLTLIDSSADGTGRLTGGNNQDDGGGVYVDSRGTFTMEGGSITDCITNSQGGGVNVNGTFNMTGGTISGCTANNGAGGGVKVSNGTFNMTGGTISGCDRGVFVDSGATFTMSGSARIDGCTYASGGGVYVNGGTFTMEGSARITGCTATNGDDNAQGGGGVYVFGGTFNVSGSPVISGNKKGDKTNNVVLNGSKTITVTGALEPDAEIHINADKGITVAQIGGTRTASLTETEAGYFKSDVSSDLLGGLNDDGQVVFKEPLPALTSPADLTYNGTEQTPELTFSGDPAPALTEGTDYTVSYKKVVGDTETALSGAPKDAGTYKAVAAGKGSYAGTSEASFTIAPKPVTVGGIKAKNKVYDTTTTAELDCSGATFAGKVDGDRLTVSGTGTFDNKNAGKDKTVTISGLTLGGESAGNYALTVTGNQETTTATITRATPEVTAPTASATYMENLSNVTLTNPSGNLSGTWTWATDNGINPNETAVGAVGTHVFRAKFTPTDTANYCETTKDVTVTVGKAMPHLTIDNFSAPYGHPVSVKITCDSDGEVTYVFYKNDGKTKTNTEDGAETEGGAPRNAGTYDIKASVAETSNYLSNEQTLDDGCVITPAPNPAVLRSTVTVRRGSDYDLSGLVSGAKGTVSFALKESKDGYSLSGSTLTLGSNAADSCTITVTADGTVDGKSNYEIFSGEITVYATDLDPQDSFGFADVAQEKTYGDGDFTVAATGAETGSAVTYSSSDPQVATVEEETGKVHILKAGETTITATAGATDTYASATASYRLTIKPKPVTISGITAVDMEYNAATAQQGMTLNTAGEKIDGMVDGDVLTVKEAIGMCEEADAGKNKTVTILRITLGGSSAGNYTVDLENSQKTTTINIGKADIPDTAITAPTGKNGLVYTGLAQSLVDAGTALGGEMRYALGTATDAPADTLYSASIPVAVNAGSYYVWYMVKGDRNHNDSSSNGPVTVTIEKASDGTINADAVELQKGDNIEASVNIRGYVGTGANITGTSQVMPDNDPGIQITDINVSNDNLTFKVSSANGGNAIITVTLTSDNYADVTLTIPVKVQAKTTEVKLDPPATGVESSVQSVTAGGLDDLTDPQSGESVKVVLEVEPLSAPQDSTVQTKIENTINNIFKGFGEGGTKTEYLDISITKQVGTGAANPVGDVGRVLELAIRYDLNGKFHPVVIREHEGTVTAFTALNEKPDSDYQDGTFYVDKDQGIIYIYSRYFSTYSIAYATVNSHTVSFDAKGGSSVDPIIVADGGMIDPLPSSSRSGYGFEGWYSSTSESGTRLTTETVINGDVTYYARWKENTTPPTPPTPPAPAATYTVSFDMNGKEATDVPKTQKVKEGKCALEPAAEPKAEGFKFAGWYREAECENRFNFSEPILADTVVYAKWIDAEAETFTVHFDLNGKAGTAPSPQIVEKGKTATRPVQDPMARGFLFTDWYTEPECTGLYDFGTPVTADITLYAGWKEDAAIVVESSEVWNLYEDASVHEYEIHGISVSGTVSNSNAKSKDYYDAKISGSTITVSVTGDRKKAAANATLEFNLGKDGVIEYELPVSYVKPVLKLSTNAATIRKGTETVLKTTLLVKNEEGSYEPYDMTDVTVSGDGLGTVTKAADGSIEIRTSAAGKGKISIVKNSWDSASPVSLSYTVKGSSKDVLSVDLGGLKTVVVNSNAKGQSFSFDVTLNGATVTAADATDDTDAADTPAVTLIDRKNTGLASISEDGKLVIAYKDGVKKGSYTITLQSGDANTNVKIRVSDKALDKAVTAKVKTKYDVVTGQGMVVVPKLKEVSGSITGVSVAESGFTAKLNAAGNIVIDYSGDKYDAKNLKIGMLTLTLTISGLENPVTVELKNVKAKKTTPKAKVAVVTIPTDAPEAADKVIGTANIISTYKDGAGMVKTIKPVKAEILDTPKGVEAKVNESDLSEIDIYGLSKKSVSFKVKLTYAGGVTKTVTVKAKRK